jgi:uncharacterized protein (TIGR02300 family)
MASSERGTKRTDPETGKKFYDLGKDPFTSPYTGKSYSVAAFEAAYGGARAPTRVLKADEDEDEDLEVEETADAGPELVPLEDAEAEENAGDEEEIPDVEDVEDVEDIGDEDDAFLEEDEDEEDIDFDVGGDDER